MPTAGFDNRPHHKPSRSLEQYLAASDCLARAMAGRLSCASDSLGRTSLLRKGMRMRLLLLFGGLVLVAAVGCSGTPTKSTSGPPPSSFMPSAAVAPTIPPPPPGK
jgi:hypothetical protein